MSTTLARRYVISLRPWTLLFNRCEFAILTDDSLPRRWCFLFLLTFDRGWNSNFFLGVFMKLWRPKRVRSTFLIIFLLQNKKWKKKDRVFWFLNWNARSAIGTAVIKTVYRYNIIISKHASARCKICVQNGFVWTVSVVKSSVKKINYQEFTFCLKTKQEKNIVSLQVHLRQCSNLAHWPRKKRATGQRLFSGPLDAHFECFLGCWVPILSSNLSKKNHKSSPGWSYTRCPVESQISTGWLHLRHNSYQLISVGGGHRHIYRN